MNGARAKASTAALRQGETRGGWRAHLALLVICAAAVCRKFQSVRQRSFRQLLLDMRLAKAEELLRERAFTVTEIAQMIGFTDLPHFDRVFRRRFGMPPSVYRRAAHQHAQ